MRIIDQEVYSNEILQDRTNVLFVVDFFAEWCGPCKMLSPILADLDAQTSDQVQVVTIDTDQNQELAEELQIVSIPTVFLVQNGEIKQRVSGLRPLEDWLELVNTYSHS